MAVLPAATPCLGPRVPRTRGRVAALMALVALAAIALYLPTLRHAYVFDDEAHIVQNPIVLEGLGLHQARWAFTTLSGTSWHPLTWLSYMGIIDAFGPAPGPQHAAGLLLHAANAALLLLVLVRLTGAVGRSAFVAALFALHPLHVESVAWAAMRKDVLYTFFWMLALLAYAHYVRRPGPARYSAVAVMFALSLMSKPMAVTLPATLLLLDGWPLGRFREGRRPAKWTQLLREKLPLLALSAVSICLTTLGGVETRVLVGLDEHPLLARLTNVPVSYAKYLVSTVWPVDLAVFYPRSTGGPPASAWVPAALVLAAVTALTLRERRRRPWMLAGWAWYLVTLLPVIGFFPIGLYARADRYTYVPLIGIFVALIWETHARTGARMPLPRTLAAPAAAVLLALSLLTIRQVGYWYDARTLFTHAREVTGGNWLIATNIAWQARREGRLDEAAALYREALHYAPRLFEATYGLANVLVQQGDKEAAIAYFRSALMLRPRAAGVWFNLALAEAQLGRHEEAVAAYRQALNLNPSVAVWHINLGNLLSELGRPAEALEAYAEALRLTPDDPDVHFSRGQALERTARRREAAHEYREVLRIRADHRPAQDALAGLAGLSTTGE